ncbi:Adenylylsulfate kinase and related kinase [Ectocarpus siliculosus]|uniref:Adenylyl-sulfate kinase n=1 Tax=Ectocarpus siliculosus TaxID=2880 RepID=D7FZA4_ECTSI|nr:Adenylylsulfate kinase and related kinase [Ectocarpus siliculosus]|eukprot:CBJ32721.1 Adenylylsulfate kinase and related kinase [Ectocarpus siliculosus]
MAEDTTEKPDCAVHEDVVWHCTHVSRERRWELKGQRGVVLWLTGLSGSGKSTVANALDVKLTAEGRHTYILDGDNVRHGLNSGLGFSPEDRRENVRRVAEVARLMVDLGIIVLVPVISPYRQDRERARGRFNSGEFVEVHVSTSLQTCEQRDPKDLYKKARAGEITNMTGIAADAPYEAPENPEIQLLAEGCSVEACVDNLLSYLRERGYLNVQPPTAGSSGGGDM